MNPSAPAPNQFQPHPQAMGQPTAPPPHGYIPSSSQDAPEAFGQTLHYHPQQQSMPTVTAQQAGPAVAVPPPKTNPNSTQNTLQFAEIRDGIVIMNDGSFRSIVMVKSINFDLMSPQEQEAVEYSYQGFLNSLYFPIQIFIRSQKVDLQPYISKLDKIRTEHDNMLLAMLMEDYINYIDQLSQQTNIMDKRFYIVIPYTPNAETVNQKVFAQGKEAIAQSKGFISGLKALFNNKEQVVTVNEADLEKAKSELRNRVQAVLAGLMQCGVQGLPLDTQELIELYYDTYNPDTATRQQLKNFNELTADIVTKGQGIASQAHLQRELQ